MFKGFFIPDFLNAGFGGFNIIENFLFFDFEVAEAGFADLFNVVKGANPSAAPAKAGEDIFAFQRFQSVKNKIGIV